MIDSIMHRYWADMEARHPLHAALGRSAVPNAILAGYQLLDEAVGRLIARVGEQTTVYVMSDHGFVPVQRRFAGNKWLREQGLLHTKGRRTSVVAQMERWAERVGLEMAVKMAAKAALKRLGVRRYESFVYQGVDWSRTRVVFGPNTGFNINLQGRDFGGLVTPAESAILNLKPHLWWRTGVCDSFLVPNDYVMLLCAA